MGISAAINIHATLFFSSSAEDPAAIPMKKQKRKNSDRTGDDGKTKRPLSFSFSFPVFLRPLPFSPSPSIPLQLAVSLLRTEAPAGKCAGDDGKREKAVKNLSLLFPLPIVSRALSFSFSPVSPRHKEEKTGDFVIVC